MSRFAVPIFTEHVHAYRLAVMELQRTRHLGTAEVTESEEYDRLLASHYNRGKVARAHQKLDRRMRRARRGR